MKPSRQSDEKILQIMHLRDAVGLTSSEIAKRLSMTRAAVCGVWNRIDNAAEEWPCAARKAVNRDGGMAPGWWR